MIQIFLKWSVSDIDFKFSVGGDDKKNSSSWILKDWQYDSEDRVWGKFYNLYQTTIIKLKELIVDSGKGMSCNDIFIEMKYGLFHKGNVLLI